MLSRCCLAIWSASPLLSAVREKADRLEVVHGYGSTGVGGDIKAALAEDVVARGKLGRSPEGELFERYAKLAFWRDLQKSKAFRITAQGGEKQATAMPEPTQKVQ